MIIKKLTKINITVCIFLFLAIPAFAKMKILPNRLLEQTFGAFQLSLLNTDQVKNRTIKMDSYKKHIKNSGQDADEGNEIEMLINNSDKGEEASTDFLSLVSSGGFFNVSGNAKSRLINNNTLGYTPGITILYGNNINPPGLSVIRNSSIGITPAGTSFGSIMSGMTNSTLSISGMSGMGFFGGSSGIFFDREVSGVTITFKNPRSR